MRKEEGTFTFSNTAAKENASKLERLYRGYRQRLYYVALQILRDPMLAEDAVHDTFLRVRDHLDQIFEEDRHKTAAFLVIIVKHIAIDYVRKRQKEQYSSIDVLEKQCGSDIQDKEEDLGLEEAFQQLSFDDAEVLRLRYGQRFTNREIARILNLPEPTVRKRLSRARKKLERLLREGEDHEE